MYQLDYSFTSTSLDRAAEHLDYIWIILILGDCIWFITRLDLITSVILRHRKLHYGFTNKTTLLLQDFVTLLDCTLCLLLTHTLRTGHLLDQKLHNANTRQDQTFVRHTAFWFTTFRIIILSKPPVQQHFMRVITWYLSFSMYWNWS